MLWENLRSEEFDSAIERSGGLCVLPVGCLEKHAQHLPVGTDAFEARDICALAAEKEEAVVFPSGLWLGDMMGQHSISDPTVTRSRGAIAMNPHTLLTVLEELCDEIARNGFRKILLVNSHGGNGPLLNYFIRSMNYKKRDYAILLSPGVLEKRHVSASALLERLKADRSGFPMIQDEDMAALEKLVEIEGDDDHASFRETAAVMGLYPELVRMDRLAAEDGESNHRADYLGQAGLNFAMAWSSNFVNCFHGYSPWYCTENIGKAVIEIAATELAKKYKLIKEDEDCIRMTMRLPKIEE